MIIELFGAPGAGKTTFAAELAARLRESGFTVELILSYRPAEVMPFPANIGNGNSLTSGLRRLGRPAAELLSNSGRWFRAAPANETMSVLFKMLPPRNLLWSIRLRQYMARLFQTWAKASQASHIVLFDQAFIQAICSFVLLSRVSDEVLIERALEAIPKPDASVLLVAPYDVIQNRLLQRFQDQSRIEHLLELSLDENLRSIAIVGDLARLLCRQGRSVTCIDSTDRQLAPSPIDTVLQQIITMAGRNCIDGLSRAGAAA